MRFTLSRVPRVPAVPRWALLIVLSWGALVATIRIVPALRRHPLTGCTFLALTGLPCPMCGATRAVLALGRGRPLEALAFNPMVAIGLAILAAYLATRFATGRSPRIGLTRRETGLAIAFAAALFLANWAWVIAHL